VPFFDNTDAVQTRTDAAQIRCANAVQESHIVFLPSTYRHVIAILIMLSQF